jgi:putative membrane protein
MQLPIRDQVPLLTVVLSVVALGAVFAAVGGVIPTSVIPRVDPLLDVIPELNVVISATAIGTIVAGWRAIRRNEVTRHRNFMLTSFALFSAFLVLYIYRISLRSPTEFPGPASIEQFVYFPILGIHILLAVLCVPLLLYVILLAVSRPVEEIYRTRHRSVGQIAAVLWVISFSLGIVVYGMLYVVY